MEDEMQTSRVFISGNSQAVRLPKEFQVRDKELYIQKIGKAIILIPKDDPWDSFEKSFGQFSNDFFSDGRNQPEMQERSGI